MTARAADHQPRRVRQAHVEWVTERLSDRDWEIIGSVVRLRLATGAQLERLHFTDLSPRVRARVRRRVLARLVAWRVLMSLERRIGGVRAGSTGLVFALDTAGQQFARHRDGTSRRPREPSVTLLSHTLSGTELYVSVVERSREEAFTVAKYLTEPACWQPLALGGWLKPDAYLRLRTAAVTDHWWLEIDKGTEHLPTIRRKLAAYLDYATSGGLGPTGVLPRVLVTVPDERRRAAVAEVIARLPDADGLLHVTTEQDAVKWLMDKLNE
jgi:protein involved in plasmid replication-relaxation